MKNSRTFLIKNKSESLKICTNLIFSRWLFSKFVPKPILRSQNCVQSLERSDFYTIGKDNFPIV